MKYVDKIVDIAKDAYTLAKNEPKKFWTRAGLAAAVVAGTYSGGEGGFPPIYPDKMGISNGININLITKFNKGSTTNGPSFSAISIDNGGTVNAGDFSLFKYYTDKTKEENAGKIRGIEFSLLRIPKGANSYPEVQGWQIGLVNNHARNGNVFQSSLYNSVILEDGNVKRGGLFNFKFGKQKILRKN